MPMTFRSEIAHCAWPAVLSDAGAQALSLQYQFDSTQWLSADELHKAALRQLQQVLGEAFRNIAHWNEALGKIGFQPRNAPNTGGRSDESFQP